MYGFECGATRTGRHVPTDVLSALGPPLLFALSLTVSLHGCCAALLHGSIAGCLRCTDPVHSALPAGLLLERGVDEEDAGSARGALATATEARRLQAELRRCTERGEVGRGLGIVRRLGADSAFDGVLHPYARAVCRHIATCHPDDLQCSAG
eukprot:SAG22_NODE_205_length_15308_cov_20.539023_29_plen_152_part_00